MPPAAGPVGPSSIYRDFPVQPRPAPAERHTYDHRWTRAILPVRALVLVLRWSPVWVPVFLIWQITQAGLRPALAGAEAPLRRAPRGRGARHAASEVSFLRMAAERRACWEDPAYREGRAGSAAEDVHRPQRGSHRHARGQPPLGCAHADAAPGPAARARPRRPAEPIVFNLYLEFDFDSSTMRGPSSRRRRGRRRLHDDYPPGTSRQPGPRSDSRGNAGSESGPPVRGRAERSPTTWWGPMGPPIASTPSATAKRDPEDTNDTEAGRRLESARLCRPPSEPARAPGRTSAGSPGLGPVAAAACARAPVRAHRPPRPGTPNA